MIDIQTYRQQIGYFNQCNIIYSNFDRGNMNFKKARFEIIEIIAIN